MIESLSIEPEALVEDRVAELVERLAASAIVNIMAARRAAQEPFRHHRAMANARNRRYRQRRRAEGFASS